MDLQFSRQIFHKFSDIKLHENSSSQLFQAYRQTDMTKLTIAFLSFPYSPNDSRKDNMEKEGSATKRNV